MGLEHFHRSFSILLLLENSGQPLHSQIAKVRLWCQLEHNAQYSVHNIRRHARNTDHYPCIRIPAIMSLAVISTAFTGQAIAVAFDRRYGALKRIGATALPVWGIIAGKSLAVVTVVFLQSIVLGSIGFALGWRPHIVGLILGAVIIALGTAGFAAMGLLVGGTLRAEIVLAIANLLWFVFAGLGALTLEGQAVPEAGRWAARLTPSGALTEALTQAMSLSVDWFGIAVLAAWGAVSALCALRWFRFT